MKKLYPILIISLLFLSVGLSQQDYNYIDLIKMDNGLWTEKFSDQPITGRVYGGLDDREGNLEKVYKGYLLYGKKEGKWISNLYGKKSVEQNYKYGKKEGKWIYWYENGTKSEEMTYKDDKKLLKTKWRRNGEKLSESIYKTDIMIFHKGWNEDGSEFILFDYR